jgi:hypothetical protein
LHARGAASRAWIQSEAAQVDDWLHCAAGDHLMFKPWMRLAVDTTLLGLEAQTVVGIRLSQIALGQDSPAETQLMM